MKRLSIRMVCEGCGVTAGGFDSRVDTGSCQRCGGKLVQRSDDNDAVVLERLKVYHDRTQPLVEYYQMRPTFRSVNGLQPPEKVAADLMTAIDSAAGRVTLKGAHP
jgi:adenylate kinase